MQKTYMTPKMKEPELVIQPAGKKDAQGNSIPRKTIQFTPNSVGVGQYKTGDAEEQKFLDNHEYMKTGDLMAMGAENVPEGSPEPKTRLGVQGSTPDAPPEAPKTQARAVYSARVKK